LAAELNLGPGIEAGALWAALGSRRPAPGRRAPVRCG